MQGTYSRHLTKLVHGAVSHTLIPRQGIPCHQKQVHSSANAKRTLKAFKISPKTLGSRFLLCNRPFTTSHVGRFKKSSNNEAISSYLLRIPPWLQKENEKQSLIQHSNKNDELKVVDMGSCKSVYIFQRRLSPIPKKVESKTELAVDSKFEGKTNVLKRNESVIPSNLATHDKKQQWLILKKETAKIKTNYETNGRRSGQNTVPTDSPLYHLISMKKQKEISAKGGNKPSKLESSYGKTFKIKIEEARNKSRTKTGNFPLKPFKRTLGPVKSDLEVINDILKHNRGDGTDSKITGKQLDSAKSLIRQTAMTDGEKVENRENTDIVERKSKKKTELRKQHSLAVKDEVVIEIAPKPLKLSPAELLYSAKSDEMKIQEEKRTKKQSPKPSKSRSAVFNFEAARNDIRLRASTKWRCIRPALDKSKIAKQKDLACTASASANNKPAAATLKKSDRADGGTERKESIDAKSKKNEPVFNMAKKESKTSQSNIVKQKEKQSITSMDNNPRSNYAMSKMNQPISVMDKKQQTIDATTKKMESKADVRKKQTSLDALVKKQDSRDAILKKKQSMKEVAKTQEPEHTIAKKKDSIGDTRKQQESMDMVIKTESRGATPKKKLSKNELSKNQEPFNSIIKKKDSRNDTREKKASMDVVTKKQESIKDITIRKPSIDEIVETPDLFGDIAKAKKDMVRMKEFFDAFSKQKDIKDSSVTKKGSFETMLTKNETVDLVPKKLEVVKGTSMKKNQTILGTVKLDPANFNFGSLEQSTAVQHTAAREMSRLKASIDENLLIKQKNRSLFRKNDQTVVGLNKTEEKHLAARKSQTKIKHAAKGQLKNKYTWKGKIIPHERTISIIKKQCSKHLKRGQQREKLDPRLHSVSSAKPAQRKQTKKLPLSKTVQGSTKWEDSSKEKHPAKQAHLRLSESIQNMLISSSLPLESRKPKTAISKMSMSTSKNAVKFLPVGPPSKYETSRYQSKNAAGPQNNKSLANHEIPSRLIPPGFNNQSIFDNSLSRSSSTMLPRDFQEKLDNKIRSILLSSRPRPNLLQKLSSTPSPLKLQVVTSPQRTPVATAPPKTPVAPVKTLEPPVEKPVQDWNPSKEIVDEKTMIYPFSQVPARIIDFPLNFFGFNKTDNQVVENKSDNQVAENKSGVDKQSSGCQLVSDQNQKTGDQEATKENSPKVPQIDLNEKRNRESSTNLTAQNATLAQVSTKKVKPESVKVNVKKVGKRTKTYKSTSLNEIKVKQASLNNKKVDRIPTEQQSAQGIEKAFKIRSKPPKEKKLQVIANPVKGFIARKAEEVRTKYDSVTKQIKCCFKTVIRSYGLGRKIQTEKEKSEKCDSISNSNIKPKPTIQYTSNKHNFQRKLLQQDPVVRKKATKPSNIKPKPTIQYTSNKHSFQRKLLQQDPVVRKKATKSKVLWNLRLKPVHTATKKKLAFKTLASDKPFRLTNEERVLTYKSVSPPKKLHLPPPPSLAYSEILTLLFEEKERRKSFNKKI